ncbi:hypothetical protein BpHYR1_008519 [Brachionus plicatilis]|uniref:Uncharacterized protein n=1 Tax=Brachionus plicatilis TaxID=10195 RepID=A0A3M7T4N4_BRAPC|nr:hypothetical protein BpHYR1_008519 [Brachionus plicatilis]
MNATCDSTGSIKQKLSKLHYKSFQFLTRPRTSDQSFQPNTVPNKSITHDLDLYCLLLMKKRLLNLELLFFNNRFGKEKKILLNLFKKKSIFNQS